MCSTLSIGRKEINQFLIKSGYEPLMARDLYEGLLLTVYIYDECADLGEKESNEVDKILLKIKGATGKVIHNEEEVSEAGKQIADKEGKADFPEEEIMLAVETDAYKEDTKYFVDFQVFVSEKVDEAIEELPEVKHLLREVPQWYLDKQKRAKRMEKRYFSEMIVKMSDKMTQTWKLINMDKLKTVSEATLRKAIANDILILKRDYLDKETYKKVLDIICRAEAVWVEKVNSGILAGMKRDSYLLLFNDILAELDSYYRDTYALKKKHSDKKGQNGGKPKK